MKKTQTRKQLSPGKPKDLTAAQLCNVAGGGGAAIKTIGPR